MRARLALGLTDSDRAAQVIALAEEAGGIDVVATPQTSDDVITVLGPPRRGLVLDEEVGPLPVLELARQLQAKHPAVGLLLLAAREASPDLLRQAVRAGFRDVLSAPMTVEALADATARGATWAQAVRERSESDDLARVAEHIGGNMIAIAGAKGLHAGDRLQLSSLVHRLDHPHAGDGSSARKALCPRARCNRY